MIRVDRSKASVPHSFDTPNVRTGKTELERIREHLAGPDRESSFDFSVYKSASVKAALDSLFHGKCAYCESYYAKTQPVDVEHYRPKSEVEGENDHPGYWWLAMAWDNLLPSCIDCNRRRQQLIPDAEVPSMVQLVENGDRNRWRQLSAGKASAFPLVPGSPRASAEDDDYDAERRLLLDPTRDDPSEHIGFYVDRDHLLSLVYPRSVDARASPILPKFENDPGAVAANAAARGVSAMGAVSIQIYGLNRLALVQARTRFLRDLEFMLELWIELGEMEFEIGERLEITWDAQAISPNPSDLGEIEFLERIGRKIASHRALIHGHMREALDPTAPFSSLAKSWAQAFINDR